MKDILKRIAIKLTSMKNLLTIWAAFTITYIVYKAPALETLAITLSAIPLAYFAVNGYQHKLDSK